MNRDREFEIDYLIGLVLVLLGFATAPILKVYLSTEAAAIILIIISIHIVLLTLVYTFRRGTNIEIQQVSKLYTLTRFTLFGISLGLSVLILMLICSAIFDISTNWPQYSSTMMTYVKEQGLRILITTISPIFIVILLTIFLGMPLLGAVIERKDIEIGIVPSEIRIQSEWESTNPLAISIKNESGRDLDVKISVSIPGDVEWRLSGEEQERSGNFSEVIEVESPGMRTLDIELRNTGETRRTRKLTVQVNYDNVELKEPVTAFIFP